jgi:hypothetical protein
MRSEHQLLLAITRVSVDPECALRIGQLVREPLDFGFLLSEARQHCLAPLLYWHLREISSDYVPADWMESLRRDFEATTRTNLHLSSHLLNVLTILEAGEVLAIPYKGPVLASLAYGNLALRPFGDLDLLVRQADVFRALELLHVHGYRSALDQTAPGGRRGSAIPGQYACRFEAGDVLVEFHTERTLRYFPRPIDMENLAGRLQRVSMSGHMVRTFSTEDLLIFLSVHGSKHLWDRLIWICDIAELLQRTKDVDWQLMLNLADQLGCRKILQLGLSLATDFLRKDLAERIPDFARSGAGVQPLASQVKRQLFESGHGPMRMAQRALFRIRTRQGFWEGIQHLFHVATAPAEADWDAVDLPKSLSVLYRAIRPFRLLWGHSLRGDGRATGRATKLTLPSRMANAPTSNGDSKGGMHSRGKPVRPTVRLNR